MLDRPSTGLPPLPIPDRRRPPAPIPPEQPLPFLRGVRAAMDNPIVSFAEHAYNAEIQVLPRLMGGFALVNAPEEVERILVRDIDNYPKSDQQQRRVRPALRDGLLTAEGEIWRAGRRIAAPLFSPRAVATAFFDDMVAVTDEMAARWEQSLSEAPVDVLAETIRLTYDIVSRTVFSGALDADRAAVHENMALYFETIGRIDLSSFFNLPEWLPSAARWRAKPALGVFRDTIRRAVETRRAERRAGGASRGDLLDRLVDATDPETGKAMPDDVVFDNMLTFLAAGHETTANTLAWLAYLLALFPWADERALEEIRGVVGAGPLRREHLERLLFLRAVVDEALRLYPPAPFLGREAKKADVIAGEPIRPGQQLLISPWVLHRHRKLWQEPDLFAPDRFLGERKQAIPRGAYIPFGLGPRICIGQAFAIQEVMTALALLLPRYRFVLPRRPEPEPVARITLRPRHGMPLKIERRG